MAAATATSTTWRRRTAPARRMSATTPRFRWRRARSCRSRRTRTVPGGTADAAGEVISYTMAVTNAGNAAMANVAVTDPFTTERGAGSGRRLQRRRHRPGQPAGCRRDLALHGEPHGDAGRPRTGGGDGDIDNTATATGTGATGCQRRRHGSGGAEQGAADREGRARFRAARPTRPARWSAGRLPSAMPATRRLPV